MYLQTGDVTFHHGHVLDELRAMDDESAQCVVTSPPYWGLRAYGTDRQDWGDFVGELGHEPTPQMFVAHLVDVFREVKRVLRRDGVCFLNVGDSHAGSGRGPQGKSGFGQHSKRQGFEGGTDNDPRGHRRNKTDAAGGLKAKDLNLIPERLAIALQDDGWYVRSRIAWCKKAPMPESVRDRPTSAWEHIWMLTRSAKYQWHYDQASEVAKHAGQVITLGEKSFSKRQADGAGIAPSGNGLADTFTVPTTRNMWNYWLLSPDPTRDAHFATFPRELVRRCLRAATKEGDVVLDPFLGSGRTAHVAVEIGRRAVGIELNEMYLRDIACKPFKTGAAIIASGTVTHALDPAVPAHELQRADG